MFKRAVTWYEYLLPSKKIGFLFLIYWIIWFLSSWLIKDKFFLNENHSLIYHIFDATWMSFSFIIIFHWKSIKLVFKNDKQSFDSN
jgi:hypothetical protein